MSTKSRLNWKKSTYDMEQDPDDYLAQGIGRVSAIAEVVAIQNGYLMTTIPHLSLNLENLETSFTYPERYSIVNGYLMFNSKPN